MNVTVTNNTEKTVKKIKALGRTFSSQLEGWSLLEFFKLVLFPEDLSSGQIRSSWVLGLTCLPLLSWRAEPHREESPLMLSQLKVVFQLTGDLLEGPSVRSQDSGDRSFPPGISDELTDEHSMVGRHWPEDTSFLRAPLQVLLTFMAGAPGLPPWVL